MFLDNYLKLGTWNCLCDVCGVRYKSDELKKRWDGYMVCPEDWEVRQPLDYIKAGRPQHPIPWSRPEPADVFVEVTYAATTVGVQDTTVPSGTFNTDTL